jgi:hypothetical protein
MALMFSLKMYGGQAEEDSNRVNFNKLRI